ncbi:Nucleotide-binding universal stress protein, UspA family [Halorientalis persicus]|uniref:Nucleotide-binding universal stress protein, UspA family n=1 Tax=Halorientalis persicus TaxID=1367881 RepID=A0A1H8QIZ6_9EURY|nr:universal stress protein [Halorientalis persicus]SEO53971.1 Nucleotide-binding universal stress protein, UspA family [Halorientalis persicus]
MYDTILVPTDGSESAQVAGTHAGRIASAFNATVHVLSVVDPQQSPITSVGDISDLADHQRTVLQEQAKDATEQINPEYDITVERHVQMGTPYEVIATAVTEKEIDLVAMGTHGRTGLQRHLLGSVAERTIRTVSVPVLTAHASASHNVGCENILVPTDGSDYADAAVNHATALAEACNSQLHLLYVGDESEGQSIVNNATVQVRDATGQPPTTVIVGGRLHEEIDTYAAETGADLIVMGTHGRTGLQRHLLGSVTERTLRTTDIPVLAIHGSD